MSQTKLPIPNQEELQKLPKDGGEKWNRLVFSSSPYLLQHAANPVDWFPWGDEAFELAKKQNKPIFLSIGYATCHWCHVMEHESFEDPAVAKLLNEDFISIKVDREERPDIDAIYMAACQLTTGHGGWPLTAILNHDKQPFFVGTYFPKESRYGRMGMLELLPKITNVWQNERTKIEDGAQAITDRLSKMNQLEPADFDGDIFKRTVDLFKSRFDSEFGGFGQAPKFPTPHQLSFLLDQYQLTQDSETLLMVEATLLAMRKGGLFDHVGFGFHRYATDREWLLPHFEKMLYDQATLLKAYAQAFHITQNPFYKSVVYEIVDYVDRVLTHPEGGFFCAEDADSEGVEGKFYVWKTTEIQSILGPDAALWSKVYQIEAEGNFKDEATHRKTGENIPHLREPLATLSKSLDVPEDELVEKLEEARRKLFVEREKRVHPLKDDKVLTDWNGLMIHALAEAGILLQDPKLTEKASRALAFVQANLSRENGQLVKSYRNGQSGLPAHIDDYSFMSAGALSLYKASFDPKYLGLATQWMDQLINHFWDKENGGFFQTKKNTELLFRNKDFYDGAIPSGNSMAAWVLAHLAHINPESHYNQYLQQLSKASAANVNHYPAGHSNLLIALTYAQAEKSELVLVGKNPAPFLDVVTEVQPQNVMILHIEDQHSQIRKLAPFTSKMPWHEGETKAYFCKNYTCSLPVSEPQALRQLLQGKK